MITQIALNYFQLADYRSSYGEGDQISAEQDKFCFSTLNSENQELDSSATFEPTFHIDSILKYTLD